MDLYSLIANISNKVLSDEQQSYFGNEQEVFFLIQLSFYAR